jgi:hypothetical protein
MLITCPPSSLVRIATGLSDDEEAYRVVRKTKADVALAAWLEKTNSGSTRQLSRAVEVDFMHYSSEPDYFKYWMDGTATLA